MSQQNVDFKRDLATQTAITNHNRAEPAILPNSIAFRTVLSPRAPQIQKHITRINTELKILKTSSPPNTQYSHPFTNNQTARAIKQMKPCQAFGFDGIQRFLIHQKVVRTLLHQHTLKQPNLHTLKRVKIIIIEVTPTIAITVIAPLPY